MIRDFLHFEDGATVPADVCIVGAGAAGITIAREFIGTHHDVLILESGGFGSEPPTQELCESEVVGLPHVSIHDGRVRIFGGTTTLWGGQALRFDAFDMQKRDWVPYSGWPITRAEIEPYYDRAARVLQLGPYRSYGDLCDAFGLEPPAFDTAKLYMECSQWSPRPNFATTYRMALAKAATVSVLLHANVTSIVTDESARTVEKIEFTTLSGKKGIARARFYIICCGGIETARLLLASNQVQPRGIGNDHDLVGRFFQEHIHIGFGELVTSNRTRLQNLFESFYRRRLKYFPIISLSQKAQAAKHLLSIHGVVGFDDAPDSSVLAMKQLFRIAVLKTDARPGEMRRYIGEALRHPGDLLRLGYHLYAKNRSGTPNRGKIGIGAQVEVAPNPESRVMLGEARDRLGMRKVKLDWAWESLSARPQPNTSG